MAIATPFACLDWRHAHGGQFLIKQITQRLIHFTLSFPMIFELQQRICNNYGAIRNEFRDYLAGRGKNILDVGCSTGTCGNTYFEEAPLA